MMIVCKPRQYTYTTNSSAENSQYRSGGILKLICEWENNGLCQIEKHAKSYRCNQRICDFADMLWPVMEKTASCNSTATEHDGIFVVSEDKVHKYVNHYKLVVLRYNSNADTHGYPALNFGNAKGLEFDRALIIPHGPIKTYLQRGDVKDVEKSLEKFYVAVTRAKHSVAFLHYGKCSVDCIEWQSTADL